MERWSSLVVSSDASPLQPSPSSWKFVRSPSNGIDSDRTRSSERSCARSAAASRPLPPCNHTKSSPNLRGSKTRECRGSARRSKKRVLDLRTRSAPRAGEAQLSPLPPKVEEPDDNDSSLENLTAERQGWMRDRLRKLFARIESDDTPAVPLVPHWSGQISLPNKEAYFQSDTGCGLQLEPSDDLGSPTQGDDLVSPWCKSLYICEKCNRMAYGERVHVQFRVDDGRVRVHLEVLHRQKLYSKSVPRLLPNGSSHIFNRTFERGRKGHSLGWFTQCFSLCYQPQVYA